MDAKNDLVKSWLTNASRNLASARMLAAGPKPIFDTAIYHCHQTVEKALKGWLTFYDHRLETTHDLRLLAGIASRIEPAFSSHFGAAERLTPYARALRHPSDLLEPELSEFEDAFESAENIFNFVCASLPPETLPDEEEVTG